LAHRGSRCDPQASPEKRTLRRASLRAARLTLR
jgi:hypothetical protein